MDRGLLPLATLVLVAAGGAGCTHTISIEAAPTEAHVVIENKSVGATPVLYDEATSSADELHVVASTRTGESVSFSLHKKTISWGPIGLGAGAGTVACLGLGTGAGALTVASVAGAPGSGGCCLVGVVPAACLGLAGLASPIVGGSAMWLLFGHQAADKVFIDFNARTVTSDPPGQVTRVRWGHTDEMAPPARESRRRAPKQEPADEGGLERVSAVGY
jgi:hypothetical protein